SFVCVAFFCFLLKYTYCLYFQLFYSFACHLPFLYFTYFFFFNEFIHALCIFFCFMFSQYRNFDCSNFFINTDNQFILFSYSFSSLLPFFYFPYFFFFIYFIHALCFFFCCMFTQSRNFDCYNFLTKSDNKLIRFFYIGTCFSNYTVYSNTSLITDLFS